MTEVGIVVFPGSNCERDVAEAVAAVGATSRFLWHGEAEVGKVDAIVVPGGFAHGDYLRPGAIARFSPVMATVADLAGKGVPVVGICNGFQVLTEAGLLPGALQKNRDLKFLCHMSELEVCSNTSVLTRGVSVGDRLRIPVNHFSGNYICDAETRRQIADNGQVVFRYVDNPNGSLDDIAGVANQAGNVVGLMPHPERAIHDLLGSTDGLGLWSGLVGAPG